MYEYRIMEIEPDKFQVQYRSTKKVWFWETYTDWFTTSEGTMYQTYPSIEAAEKRIQGIRDHVQQQAAKKKLMAEYPKVVKYPA